MPTVSIRIVADYVAHYCQVIRTSKRAKAFNFTTNSAIIFIYCCIQAFIIGAARFKILLYNYFLLLTDVTKSLIQLGEYINLQECPRRPMLKLLFSSKQRFKEFYNPGDQLGDETCRYLIFCL
ncbi:MAG: hypothetical protein ACI9XB_001095 [Gammaproteobacteria bacterium]|jgi:hypothetical protein